MLQFSKKDDEIILRDIPVGEFVPIGLIIAFTIFLFLFGRDNSSLILPLFIGDLALLIIGIYKTSFIEIKTVKINERKRIVSVNNRSLVKNISYVYRFGEIDESICVETLLDAGGKLGHKLILPLENGERIELTRSASSNKDKYIEAAKIMNQIISGDSKKLPQNFMEFNKF